VKNIDGNYWESQLRHVKEFGFAPAQLKWTPRSQAIQWAVFRRFSSLGIFFMQIMQKSISSSASVSFGDGIFFCGVFDFPRPFFFFAAGVFFVALARWSDTFSGDVKTTDWLTATIWLFGWRAKFQSDLPILMHRGALWPKRQSL